MSQKIQPNPSNRCKFLASILKCPSFPEELQEEDEPGIDFDEEDDQVFVSAIISKYMESKCKKQPLYISPESGYFIFNPKAEANSDQYLSAGSCLSRCSSATSFDAFVSVKTSFSRSSSLNRIHLQDLSRVELSQCEGWPFGLYRKAFLLPPLPKPPPDSWSWRNKGGMAKIHA